VNNYEFCADFAAARGGRVLDYGCGAGEIVQLLNTKGVDVHGCDVFYDGGSSAAVGLSVKGVRRMEGDRIPFPDEHFDIVVHNQVFEHVPNIAVAVSEIARVLKRGGLMLGLFPDLSCWREGHCGVPFLHWFRTSSRLRIYYALAFRTLGFGYHHGSKTRMQWAREFCSWLDAWTYYRSHEEIHAALECGIGRMHHIEHEWLDKRAPRLAWLPRVAKSVIARRGAGLVVVCEKR
jgi:SAM-dependent methyltransferase